MKTFISFLILGVIVASGIWWNYKQTNTTSPSPSVPVSTDPYRATLTGVQVCLPHKDTSGPQTMECAFGMKTDDGKHYALDFMLMSQTPPNIQNGQRFSASGLVTPIENLSSDHWQKYDVVGIFSVTDSVQVF